MSTLAAARADNFYYPPTFDPKKGGLNKQQGQHPLRERAKKLNEGILVIRFEMPFNVWCNGCQHLIGKGVRFNAEKKQIGNYHSTKIWSFSMTSPCCQTRIEVHTDPKNCEYQIVAGARRKAEAYTAKDAGVMELDDPEEAAAAARDPFRKLERGDADKRKAREAAQQLSMLVADSRVKHRDDYAINKELRRRNRGLRKEEAVRDEHRQRLNLPDSITLAPQTEQDRQAASLVVFGNPARFDERWRERRRAIHQAPIFAPAALPTTRSTPALPNRGPSAAQSSAPFTPSSAAATSPLPPNSNPAAPQSRAAAHGSDAHASAEPCINEAQIPGSASRDDSTHGHHEHDQHSAGCIRSDSRAAQAGRHHPGQGLAPSAKQSAWAAKLQAKGSALGLKAAAGVRKPIPALRHAGSKLGSKHGRAQAGKLSRIRLGAKLVLGNVPA